MNAIEPPICDYGEKLLWSIPKKVAWRIFFSLDHQATIWFDLSIGNKALWYIFEYHSQKQKIGFFFNNNTTFVPTNMVPQGGVEIDHTSLFHRKLHHRFHRLLHIVQTIDHDQRFLNPPATATAIAKRSSYSMGRKRARMTWWKMRCVSILSTVEFSSTASHARQKISSALNDYREMGVAHSNIWP